MSKEIKRKANNPNGQPKKYVEGAIIKGMTIQVPQYEDSIKKVQAVALKERKKYYLKSGKK